MCQLTWGWGSEGGSKAFLPVQLDALTAPRGAEAGAGSSLSLGQSDPPPTLLLHRRTAEQDLQSAAFHRIEVILFCGRISLYAQLPSFQGSFLQGPAGSSISPAPPCLSAPPHSPSYLLDLSQPRGNQDPRGQSQRPLLPICCVPGPIPTLTPTPNPASLRLPRSIREAPGKHLRLENASFRIVLRSLAPISEP